MEEKCLATLYAVLKDHDNESLLFHFAKSQSRVLQREALKDGVELESPRLLVGQNDTPSCLAKLHLTEAMDPEVARELAGNMRELRSLINLKFVDKSANGIIINYFFSRYSFWKEKKQKKNVASFFSSGRLTFNLYVSFFISFSLSFRRSICCCCQNPPYQSSDASCRRRETLYGQILRRSLRRVHLPQASGRRPHLHVQWNGARLHTHNPRQRRGGGGNSSAHRHSNRTALCTRLPPDQADNGGLQFYRGPPCRYSLRHRKKNLYDGQLPPPR